VSIEDTIAVRGRKVRNIVNGVLKNVRTPPEKPFVPSCREVCSESHKRSNCCQRNCADSGLCNSKMCYSTYICYSIHERSSRYLELMHITWVAHVFVRACKTINLPYPNVEKPVANENKMCLRSSTRIQLFKNNAPGTKLPPPPKLQ
jgi:hypothetical protein